MDQEEKRIIQLAKENDDEAIEIIIKRYKNITFSIIREHVLYLKSMERDDFIQEGNIGIVKAIKYFDMNKNIKFSTFVRVCIRSQLISFVKKHTTKKHNVLTETIYCRKFTDRDVEYETLIEDIYSSDKDNPEKLLLLKELFEELKIFFQNELSRLEQEIFILLLKGYSYKDISSTLERKPKKIDNTIQRIRQKLKKSNFNKVF